MRVAIVHDDLMQWGGAERALQGLTEIYPDAPIFTSVFDKTNPLLWQNFGTKKVVTSFLQKIPGWKIMYKALLPFYPLAFEQFNFDNFDLVISQTTRFAKSIITKPHTIHICYCHTPPRFLWHFSDQINYGFLEILLSKLRIYDQISARRVDYFIAGSQNAKERIKKIYRSDSKVIYPFVDLERFKDVETFDGGYFVVISRLNKYKRIDLAVKTCLKLRIPLKVIGVGSQANKLKQIDTGSGLIEFLGAVDDKIVTAVLAGAKALIIPGVEDFGLASLEAQALGKAVIAYRFGGSLETVIDGKTGVLFDLQQVNSLEGAIIKLDSMEIGLDDCIQNAVKFSKGNFIKSFQAIVAGLL